MVTSRVEAAPPSISMPTRIWQFIKENKSLSFGIFILSIIVFMALFADIISPYGFAERSDNCGEEYPGCRFAPPSSRHLMGTNIFGRDVFSRIIYGSRTALQMSIGATVIALSIGLPLGILAGYYGGTVDRLLNAVADAIYSFPSLLLAIIIAISLSKFGDLGTIAAVSLSTSVVYIPIYFKIIRSQVLKEREESYIDAAKAMGASNFTIILRYVTPNVIAAPIALIPFNMTEAILVNAGLAFLGLGISPPTADWGYDVFENKSLARIRMYPWLIIFPGVMIFLMAFAFSLIGDALNDRFNPLVSEENNE